MDIDTDLVVTRADLLGAGMTPRAITRAVREGRMRRLRRDRYLLAPQDEIERAVRIGGRVACTSLLAMYGVFVLTAGGLHVHLEHTMSRLRSPFDATRRLSEAERDGLHLHWWPLTSPSGLAVVDIRDAVAQSVRCQTVRAAVATVDSVLYLRLLTWVDLRDVFAGLPRRYQAILAVADGSAESGPETLMRLLLRQLGLRYRTQVSIPGVGRVDFVVEGWLIIECDSRAHHEGWDKQREDRRRDLAAAALGYSTLRPLAEHLYFDTGFVLNALRGIVRAHHS